MATIKATVDGERAVMIDLAGGVYSRSVSLYPGVNLAVDAKGVPLWLEVYTTTLAALRVSKADLPLRPE